MPFNSEGKYEPKGMPVKYDEYEREFEKTFYIKDKTARLAQMLKIEEARPPQLPVKDRPTKYDLGHGFAYGFEYEAERRKLQIEVKILELIEQAGINSKGDPAKEIELLINARYTEQKNLLLYDWENLYYADEYNDFIGDKIQDRIRELAAPETAAVEEAKGQSHAKLKWKLGKNVLGTLFGVLLKTGAIEGSHAAVNSFILSAFDGFRKTSLEDNLKLKEFKHSDAAARALGEFKEFIVKSLGKQGIEEND
ncbi:MAG: hypothetical protein V4543_12350 [Bacteroidota bacterium]